MANETRRRHASWAVLPAVLALACAGGSRSPDASGGHDVFVAHARTKLAGVGSRALTDRLAATYFIRSADPKGDFVMDYVVFLKGASGWTQQKADWKFSTSEPVAFSRYVILGKEFLVELDLANGAGRVLGQTTPLSTANVVVVQGFGGPALERPYAEHQDLRVPFDADPMREVVGRSPALQRALELAPR